jgi:hypothetical protein
MIHWVRPTCGSPMSLEEKRYWEYACPPASIIQNMPLGLEIGKWCIFIKRQERDKIWPLVAAAAQAGRFWRSVKISTEWGNENYVRRNPGAIPDEFVICVYTYKDQADVFRVRDELEAIGILQPLGYKTDAATAAGLDFWEYQDPGFFG